MIAVLAISPPSSPSPSRLPARAVNDGTSNTRLAAFTPPTSPPTPPGVLIPYPNFPDPVQVPTRPIK